MKKRLLPVLLFLAIVSIAKSQIVKQIDLSVYNANISTNIINSPDSTITVGCCIKNIGDTISQATSLNIYLSNDNILNLSEDAKFNFFFVDGIPVDSSFCGQTLVKLPTNVTKGNWYIILYIYPMSQDKDISNNQIAIPITYTQIEEYNTTQNNYLSVYPNPVIDKLFVNTINNKNMVWSIYSIDGRLLNKNQLKDQYIDLKFLHKGLYFVNINDGNNINKTFKIVKN